MNAAAPQTPRESRNDRAPRILVVEDDPAIAEITGIALRAEGFEPSFCSDGLTAMDVFRRVQPDLVLLDLIYIFF